MQSVIVVVGTAAGMAAGRAREYRQFIGRQSPELIDIGIECGYAGTPDSLP